MPGQMSGVINTTEGNPTHNKRGTQKEKGEVAQDHAARLRTRKAWGRKNHPAQSVATPRAMARKAATLS